MFYKRLYSFIILQKNPRFPLDGLVVYFVYIHGLISYLHGSRVEPHTIDAFDWL